MKIKDVRAREILDSRGNPTVEVDVILEDNSIGRASVPSGASTGIYEAYELRDNDLNRYNGQGVLMAVNNVNEIIKPNLINLSSFNQKKIDDLLIKLDGTSNKSKLGANAILATSLAVSRASSNSLKKSLYAYLGEGRSLPTPMMNIINGGKHANNNIDIQEFMIVPILNTKFKEKVRMCVEVFHSLKKVLKEDNIAFSGVGDEGGYAPNLKDDEEALKVIVKAIKKANYKPYEDFMIALDIASSEWYNEKEDNYTLEKSNKTLSKEELINYYEYLVNEYPIMSIEDPLGENDFEGWKLITNKLGNKIMLVGDDLFVTNKERLNLGIKENLGNSILIKYNQIGTLSETLETINLAKENNFKTIISHRSGETDDTFISHLAVATSSLFIKTGAPSRMERVSKYNELMRIEEEINN